MSNESLNDEERRELVSLREWRRIVTDSPESAQAEVLARMLASARLQPVVQTWRERVTLLERAYLSAHALLERIGVDDEWEDGEGVSLAPALAELQRHRDALRRPFSEACEGVS